MQAVSTGFETVYRREFPFVWAAARRFGVHPAVIDDAVQDVFLTAYRRWSDLDYEVSPRAWLYGVTRRVASRYRRTEARTARRKAVVGRAPVRPPRDPHASRDEARDIETVLAPIPVGRREVYVMAELLGMTGPEIAAELAIPLNTVYSRLRLARRQVERRVESGAMQEWMLGARRRDAPPHGQARRTWAVLLPSLGSVPGAGAGAWASSKVTGMLTAATLVGALVTAGWLARRPASDVGTSESAAVAVKASPTAKRGRSREVERLPVSPAAVVDVTPVVKRAEATPPLVVHRPRDGRGTDGATRAAAADAHPVETAAEPRPKPQALPPRAVPAVEPSVLEAEVAMLDRAAAALRGNDATRALELLAQHQRRFPDGQLADVRHAARVRALCHLGRDAQAHAEARRLRREHPASAVAQGVPDSCDGV
ncbi:MAG: sigma-70 family RNA polymerase sigma factor [Deltaproteobacteria bacterium]|nr:sigma-70 family RNA polymerase sigma factor [Deltaproteobacteria bacterium]